MAPTIIDSDAVQGETFLPGQIFVFGGFALQIEQIIYEKWSEKFNLSICNGLMHDKTS